MVFFKKLAAWFFVKRKLTGTDDHPDLNPLNLDELMKELGIEQKAKRLGEAGLPSPDATEYSAPELAIIQRLEATRRRYLDWALVSLSAIHDRLTTFDITKVVNRALQYGDEYERVANAELSDAQAELRRRQLEAETKQKELEHFRKKNGLTRNASCPSLIQRAIFILFAVAIVGSEGCANSVFFAQGLDGGLILGFFYAFMLALLNFGISFSFGRFGLPYKNHITPFGKLIGFISLLMALSTMVTLGLVISHFRDSLSSSLDGDMNIVAAVALDSMKKSPLGLKDIMSWILFTVSILFAFVGLIEGYFWGDRYPGYQKKQKDTSRAEDDYEELIKRLRDNLADLKEEYLLNLEHDVERAKVNVLEFRSQVEYKRRLPLKLHSALGKAENMLTTLVFCFRNENEIYRNKLALPKPAYFNTKPTFQDLELPSFDTSADEISLAKQEDSLIDLLGKVESIRAQIQSAYDMKFNQLKPIHKQFGGYDHA